MEGLNPTLVDRDVQDGTDHVNVPFQAAVNLCCGQAHLPQSSSNSGDHSCISVSISGIGLV